MTSARLANRVEQTHAVGMVVFLASWAMVFIALLFAHLILETTGVRSVSDPPTGIAAISTAILLLGIVVVRASRSRVAAAVLFAFGALFLCAQIVLWRECWLRELWPTESKMASSIYALTGFHALHVLVGLLGLSIDSLRGGHGLRFWRWYWEFVAAVWLAIFVVVFV